MGQTVAPKRRPVPGYEGLYEVCESGKIFSLITNRVLKPILAGHGYPVVVLYKTVNGVRTRKNHYVHRLVAEVFIPNPFGFETVDHLSGDKIDASVENLRWLDRAENTRREHRRLRSLVDPTGKTHTFTCIREFCREQGLHYPTIGAVLRGERQNYKKWKAS